MQRSAAFLIPLFFGWLLLFSVGCNKRSVSFTGPIEAAERDSIITFIESVSQDAIRASFEELNAYSYRRYLRTEQFDDEDFLIAFTEQLVDVSVGAEGRTSSVTRADSGGAFDFGFFNQFVSENVDDPNPVDLVPYLIKEDPSYLNPKNIEKYSFRMMGDTLMWDRSAMIIEIRARPDLVDGLNVRKVRYYVDRMTNELVAVYLERIDLGLLFREESTFFMHIRPAEGDIMVPYNTRFTTLIRTPFRGAYKIRTVSTYTDHTL